MKNSVTIKEMTRAEENHMIRTNEIVTLYHGSKSGIRGILDEQKLTEDDRKKLKQESKPTVQRESQWQMRSAGSIVVTACFLTKY